MKNKKLFLLLLAVLLVFASAPLAAHAADSDFDVAFEIYPQDVGYWGGVVQLSVTVTNTGSSNITWVNVVINNETPYSGYWAGTITPGHSNTISFRPRFSMNDLAVPRILQVTMNNNSTANPDGLKTMNFQVGKITEIFDTTCTISPTQTVYRPGDTVTVTHSFTNNVETHAALGVRSTITMMIGSRSIYDGVEVGHGNVNPGQTVTSSFRYTFGEDDEGIINVYYRLKFSLMDQAYELQDFLKQFEVRYRTPVFSASLYADPTTINPGDPVTFRIAIGNTGEDAIGRFEVTDLGGATVAEAEGLPAGGSGSVTFTAPVYESGAVSYVVIGTNGTESRSLETNTIPITVQEDAADAADEGGLAPSGSSSAYVPSGSSSPAATHSGAQAASPSAVQEAAAAAGELSAQDAKETPPADSILPAVLIAVIAATTVVIVLLLVLLKKRKKSQ